MHIRIFLILFFIIPQSTFAKPTISISPSILYFNYEETDIFGDSFNKEIGWLPGVAIDISKNRYSLGAQINIGTVEYDGATQPPASIPVETDTDASLFNFYYKHLFSDPQKDYQFFGRLNYNFWNRAIQPSAITTSLTEEYSWWNIEAGVQSKIELSNNLQFHYELAALRTFAGEILIDLEDAGFGQPVLDLANENGVRSLFSLDIDHSNDITTSIGLEYKYWGFGRSNTKTITNGVVSGTITEPRSKTSTLRLFLQFTQSF